MRRQTTLRLCALCSLLALAHALEFDLLDRSNTKDQGAKCILEEMHENVLALVEYSSVDGTHISVKLEDPKAAIIYTQEATESGQFGFTTKLSGDYKICFTKTEPGVGEVSSHKIKLDWKTGVAASDWDSIAKKDNVDKLSLTLRELEAEIKEVHEGMLYLREREEEMRDINESTNARVAWLSVLSLGMCIALSVWQVIYLKSFFQRKKLL